MVRSDWSQESGVRYAKTGTEAGKEDAVVECSTEINIITTVDLPEYEEQKILSRV